MMFCGCEEKTPGATFERLRQVFLWIQFVSAVY